jgi:site-specific recombinase XerD
MNSQERWEVFQSSLKDASRQVYLKRVEDYVEWCGSAHEEPIDPFYADNVRKYLVTLKETEDYAAKTLWTIYSMISSYYECHHNHKIHVDLPMIQTLLKNWEKEDEVKKAKSFTKEEIFSYLENAPSDDNHHVRKVAAIIAISGLLRRAELTELQ